MPEVKLTNSPLVFLVDDEDYPIVSRITWSLDNKGYPHTSKFRIHQLVTGLSFKLVDHKDRNKLNNKKSNLRAASVAQNNANADIHKDSTTGFKGVTFVKRSGKYMARLGSRKSFLGNFECAEDAARAYDKAAKAKFGEFAHLNFEEIV